MFLLGVLVFAFTHGYALNTWPGLHYDEAWAGLYAARIAAEPEFWPLSAMSPYTMPWAHYWAAIFFKWFGVSLEIFRTSQLVLVGLGMLLSAAALRREFGKKTATIFVWLVALVPLSILNHRFAIELTGWHVLMAGLFIWGLSRRNIYVAALAVVFGVTAHVLFLALPLACVGVLLLKGYEFSKRDRYAIAGTALALLPFFLLVTLKIPEHGKGMALCYLVAAIAAVFLFAPTKIFKIPHLEWLVLVASIPFVANLIFYSEGHWLQTTISGVLPTPITIAGSVLVLIVFAACLCRERLELRGAFLFFVLTNLMLGAMMLKPAPRYYEIGLWTGMLLLAVAARNLRTAQLIACAAVLSGFCLTSLALNSDYAWHRDLSQNRPLRLGPWKDNSVDFLPKQKLVQFLGLKGCSVSGIKGGDPRIITAMHFLSYGDWPVRNQQCPWPNYRVELEELTRGQKAEAEFLPFRIFLGN